MLLLKIENQKQDNYYLCNSKFIDWWDVFSECLLKINIGIDIDI